MKEYVCIDIGGTAIKAGVLDENARIIEQLNIPTEAMQGGSYVLARVKKIIERYIVLRKITGICISTTGMVDAAQGSIIYANENMPGYMGINLKKEIERTFGILCEVENDVNCAGLAEYRSGAAKGSHVALILTIGTGIGGSIIMDGEVYHGFSNSACEVGYMHMNDSDFQTLGAASILTKKVSEWKGETEKKWDGYHIFEEAKKGDKLCLLAIDEMVDILGEGIANICYVINPEVVVLGGGIMAQEQFLKERVECAVKRYLVSSIEEHTKIVFAKHQNDAGMLGAFYHFCSLH